MQFDRHSAKRRPLLLSCPLPPFHLLPVEGSCPAHWPGQSSQSSTPFKIVQIWPVGPNMVFQKISLLMLRYFETYGNIPSNPFLVFRLSWSLSRSSWVWPGLDKRRCSSDSACGTMKGTFPLGKPHICIQMIMFVCMYYDLNLLNTLPSPLSPLCPAPASHLPGEKLKFYLLPTEIWLKTPNSINAG